MAWFDDVKASFWETGDYGVQPTLTEAAVEEAESLLGVRLPSALLGLLRVRNGGAVADRWNAFPVDRPNSWADGHVPLNELFGIGRREGMLSLLDTPYLVEEWGLPSPVVLLSGDGHWWIALDYRAGEQRREPPVIWIDADRETDFLLAADFRSFVQGLVPAAGFQD
ncbi:SMI1/KNR4 family protein [Actinomadura verrucosospora]|uniref:SMI1 / KNR4 family protein n=1 Tax=Actinomadura verrucosospora TaxID=46165 RepID=A0A7D3VTE4_ACTVE|nr:SMI1/KNR4 family protein [Actinomadura verrucosospora]QKG22600.1 SMI1 / KNR4 family protein [Actinomadura verrucosospora]